ncbi:unnamed protein product [Closterium sp. Naga37s-1]|nr:unnamed protein product [Closterium sp. Naga37s-1]
MVTIDRASGVSKASGDYNGGAALRRQQLAARWLELCAVAAGVGKDFAPNDRAQAQAQAKREAAAGLKGAWDAEKNDALFEVLSRMLLALRMDEILANVVTGTVDEEEEAAASAGASGKRAEDELVKRWRRRASDGTGTRGALVLAVKLSGTDASRWVLRMAGGADAHVRRVAAGVIDRILWDVETGRVQNELEKECARLDSNPRPGGISGPRSLAELSAILSTPDPLSSSLPRSPLSLSSSESDSSGSDGEGEEKGGRAGKKKPSSIPVSSSDVLISRVAGALVASLGAAAALPAAANATTGAGGGSKAPAGGNISSGNILGGVLSPELRSLSLPTGIDPRQPLPTSSSTSSPRPSTSGGSAASSGSNAAPAQGGTTVEGEDEGRSASNSSRASSTESTAASKTKDGAGSARKSGEGGFGVGSTVLGLTSPRAPAEKSAIPQQLLQQQKTAGDANRMVPASSRLYSSVPCSPAHHAGGGSGGAVGGAARGARSGRGVLDAEAAAARLQAIAAAAAEAGSESRSERGSSSPRHPGAPSSASLYSPSPSHRYCPSPSPHYSHSPVHHAPSYTAASPSHPATLNPPYYTPSPSHYSGGGGYQSPSPSYHSYPSPAPQTLPPVVEPAALGSATASAGDRARRETATRAGKAGGEKGAKRGGVKSTMRQKAFFGAGVVWSVEEGGLEEAGGERESGESDESGSREGDYDEGSSSEEDKDDNTLGFSRKYNASASVSASASASACASPYTPTYPSATGATPLNQRPYAPSPAHSALSRPSPSRSTFSSSPAHASSANSPARAAFSSSPARGAFSSTSIARSASSGTASPAACAAAALRSVMKGSSTNPHSRGAVLRRSASESGSSRGDGVGDSGEMAIGSKSGGGGGGGAMIRASSSSSSSSNASTGSSGGDGVRGGRRRSSKVTFAKCGEIEEEEEAVKEAEVEVNPSFPHLTPCPLSRPFPLFPVSPPFPAIPCPPLSPTLPLSLLFPASQVCLPFSSSWHFNQSLPLSSSPPPLSPFSCSSSAPPTPLEKQAKYMRMKLGGVKEDEEDEDEEDEDEEDGEGALWGQKKREYYSADNVDYELHMDGETGAQEEEEEALRLQQQIAAGLRVEDYEEEGEEEGEEGEEGGEEEGEEEEGEGEETMLEKVEKEGRKKGDKGSDKGNKGSDKALERKGRGVAVVERVVKDASLLTKEEQMAALMSDAPELVGLLSDLKTTLKELNTKVLPLLQQVREGEYATENGVSYLEAKHGLLLHYCCCLLFFLLLRAEGKPVRDHPVVSRLVELRLFLEKIRPIDKKLQYQIEKLLKLASSANRGATPGKQSAAAAEAGVGGSLDDLKHRPNPNLLVSKLGGSGGDGGEDGGVSAGGGGGAGGIYKPPKIAPMAMDGEKEGGKKGGEVGARREEREMREARRRAARSAFVKELAEDVEGRPHASGVEGASTMMVEGKEMARAVERLRVEIEAIMRVEGASTMMVEGKEMEREVERLRERAAAEEKMFSRVPLNRGEKQRLKALKQSQNMLAGMLDDFDDDIAGIMAAGEEGAAQAGLTAAAGAAGGAAGGIGGLTSAGMLESLLRPRKLSEAIHEAGKITSLRGAQGKVISGDADLPLKPDLGERRRAYEAGVVAKQVRKRGSEDLGFDQGDEDGGEGEGGEGGEEDEFYAEARKMQEARRSAKAAKYSS